MSRRQELLTGITEDLKALTAKVEELAGLEGESDTAAEAGGTKPSGADESPPEEARVSYDDARVVFHKKFREGKRDAVMKLVEPYKVKSLRDIPEEELPKLIKEVEGL